MVDSSITFSGMHEESTHLKELYKEAVKYADGVIQGLTEAYKVI